jgi:hypothetical protein
MDAKGRLIITDEEGNETFKGDSFEETGMNREKRRKEAAMNRKRKRKFEGNWDYETREREKALKEIIEKQELSKSWKA